MKSREVIKTLKSDGWFVYKIKGSHVHFKHPIKSGKVTVPMSRHYNELVLNFVNLCYTDLLSYDRRLTHDQFSRSQG